MSSNGLAVMERASVLPSPSEMQVLGELAATLIPTGFLPDSIKSPAQAIAIMLKGRELGVPPMYALSNIVIVKGKPTISAEMMLALIHRDHGQKAMRIRESDDKSCTVEYRQAGWPDVSEYTFTIQMAMQAGLGNNPTWKAYPAAMLRARCISSVARMAFPESIAGMYTPGELGEDVLVTEDGEVQSILIASPAPSERVTPTATAPVEPDRNKVAAKYFAIVNEKGLTDDERKILQRIAYGVESSKDLTIDQMQQLAERIQQRSLKDLRDAVQRQLDLDRVVELPGDIVDTPLPLDDLPVRVGEPGADRHSN